MNIDVECYGKHKLLFMLPFTLKSNFQSRGIDAQPILNGYCGSYEAYFEDSQLNEPVFNYFTKNNSNGLKNQAILYIIISAYSFKGFL
jgi:hypothetical protein